MDDKASTGIEQGRHFGWVMLQAPFWPHVFHLGILCIVMCPRLHHYSKAATSAYTEKISV